jgi:uncharacterized membrane protein YbaN (DUF454 family)
VTTQQAKQILQAFRPWATDAHDPEMAEALALCRENPELAQWLEAHNETQAALRNSFRKITPPEAFKEQIVSEYNASLRQTWWRRPAVVATLALIVIVVAIGSILMPQTSRGPKLTAFETFRTRMVNSAVKTYSMDVETNDVAQIRAYLAGKQAHADYVPPAHLDEKTSAVGCAALSWQGKPVAMICYKTGLPLADGTKSDMFLFVVDAKDVPNSPRESTPEFAKVSVLSTATWSQNGKLYLLAALDESELKRRL